MQLCIASSSQLRVYSRSIGAVKLFRVAITRDSIRANLINLRTSANTTLTWAWLPNVKAFDHIWIVMVYFNMVPNVHDWRGVISPCTIVSIVFNTSCIDWQVNCVTFSNATRIFESTASNATRDMRQPVIAARLWIRFMLASHTPHEFHISSNGNTNISCAESHIPQTNFP